MTKRKRPFKLSSLWLLVMFLVGSGLVLLALTQSHSVSRMGETAMRKMTVESVQRVTEASKGKTAPFNYAKTSQLTPLTVGGYEIRELTGHSGYDGAVGQLRVPAVGVNLPIGIGVSNAVMVRGAGTLKADQRMGQGNYALAGHYMTSKQLLFSPLKQVNQGDSVYLSNASQVYRYRVTRVRVVDRHKVDVIDDVPGQKLVTLVTCASAKRSEPNRLVVQGQLVSVKRVAT